MAPNPRRQDEKLDALYASLPKIECQKLCASACGPIEMSIRERVRLEQAAGKPCKVNGKLCALLTADGHCSAYAVRPMICRVWGLTRALRCPYGCVPERWLTDAECYELIGRADLVGGKPDDTSRSRRILEQSLEALHTPEGEKRARKIARKLTKRPVIE